jgi:hypothetical protein
VLAKAPERDDADNRAEWFLALDQRLAQEADLTEEVFAQYAAHSYGLISEAPEPLPGHCLCVQRMLMALFGIASAILQSGELVPSGERQWAYLMWLRERWPIPRLSEAPTGCAVARIPDRELLNVHDGLYSVAHEVGHCVTRCSSRVDAFFSGLEKQLDEEYGAMFQDDAAGREMAGLWRRRVCHGLEQIMGDVLALRTVFMGDLDLLLRSLEERVLQALGTHAKALVSDLLPAVGRGLYVWCFHRVEESPGASLNDILKDRASLMGCWEAYVGRLKKPGLNWLVRDADNVRPGIAEGACWWTDERFVERATCLLQQLRQWAPDWRDEQAGFVESARRACHLATETLRRDSNAKRQRSADSACSAESWTKQTEAILHAYDAALLALGGMFARLTRLDSVGETTGGAND